MAWIIDPYSSGGHIWCTQHIPGKELPLVEGTVLILHIVAFFAIMIPLWVLAPRTSAKSVFTEFTSQNGWSNTGLACLGGIIGPTVSLLGSDAATHMSEELQDASYVIPKQKLQQLSLMVFLVS
jgi:Mn2+/Fe2+ NRAMP family transporter